MFSKNTYNDLIREFYSVHYHNDGNITEYNLLKIKKKKNSLQLTEQQTILTFDELLVKLKKNIPVIFSMTGKKVISKPVKTQENYLDKLLFNNNPEDFYIYEMYDDDNVLLSITRREDMDFHINEFLKRDLSVIFFSLGSFVLESLKALIPGVETIHAGYFEYDFETKTEKTNPIIVDELIIIEDEKIANKSLMAFSNFICYLNRESSSLNYSSYLKKLWQDFTYKKAFKFVGMSCLILFFLLLTASYMLQSFYTGKNSYIQEEIYLNSNLSDRIRKMENDIIYKENIVASSGIESKHFISFYLTEIANSVPSEINLTEVEVYPVEAQMREREKIRISSNLITVSGVAHSRAVTNQWILELEKLSWTDKIELLSYSFTKNEYHFLINIYIHV